MTDSLISTRTSESTGDAPAGSVPVRQKSPSARKPGCDRQVRSEMCDVERFIPDGNLEPSSFAETMVKRRLCANAVGATAQLKAKARKNRKTRLAIFPLYSRRMSIGRTFVGSAVFLLSSLISF